MRDKSRTTIYEQKFLKNYSSDDLLKNLSLITQKNLLSGREKMETSGASNIYFDAWE